MAFVHHAKFLTVSHVATHLLVLNVDMVMALIKANASYVGPENFA